MKPTSPIGIISNRTNLSTRVNSRLETKDIKSNRINDNKNLHLNEDNIINNLKTEKSKHSVASIRSSSSKLNKMNKILTNSNMSNIQILENMIKEVKSNAFDKIKEEIENKTKEKNFLLKEIELLKNNIKLHGQEEKLSIKTTFNHIHEHNQLKAIENRVQNEQSNGLGLEETKNDISKMKFEYENLNEESRILRNDMLFEEKSINLIKDDITKCNKMVTDCNREKESMKVGMLQLKRHVKLMKDKIKAIDDKNKNILMQFYSLSLN